MATKYEMHVYTMGTRAYAEEVCAAIDPGGKIFGNRILSRDESGSECLDVRSREQWRSRFRQVSHRRASNGSFLATSPWSSSSTTEPTSGPEVCSSGAPISSKSCLVRYILPLLSFANVPSDDFFIGIGDINSSFLPKIPPLVPQATPPGTTPIAPCMHLAHSPHRQSTSR